MKKEEMRELKADELKKRESDLRKELALARINWAAQKIKNPAKIRELRRDIARVLTVLTEKGVK